MPALVCQAVAPPRDSAVAGAAGAVLPEEAVAAWAGVALLPGPARVVRTAAASEAAGGGAAGGGVTGKTAAGVHAGGGAVAAQATALPPRRAYRVGAPGLPSPVAAGTRDR